MRQQQHSYRDHRGKARDTPFAPGAFVVPHRPQMQQFGVVVPHGVRAGQQFQCLVNGALQSVVCPTGANPGQQIIISVPRVSQRADASSVTVHVPAGVRPGMPFQVFHNGSYTRVVCPEGVAEGGLLKVTIKPPVRQMFEVEVPAGVAAGQAFVVHAGGQQVQVQCPTSWRRGEKIRFQHFVTQEKGGNTAATAAGMEYETPGWQRCLGVDGAMHWAMTAKNPDGQEIVASTDAAAEGKAEEKEGGAASEDEEEEEEEEEEDKQGPGWGAGLEGLLRGAQAEVKEEAGGRAGGGDGGTWDGAKDLAAAAARAKIGRDGAKGVAEGGAPPPAFDMSDPFAVAGAKDGDGGGGGGGGGEKETSGGGGGAAAGAKQRGGGGVQSHVFVRQLTATDGLGKDSSDGGGASSSSSSPYGSVTLVNPTEFALPLDVPGLPLAYSELAYATAQPFAAKLEWFRAQLKVLKVPWDEGGKVKVQVERGNLLQHAFEGFSALPAEKFRNVFEIEFLGEPGLDCGGVAREFYELTSAALFNPDVGLFEAGGTGGGCSMAINPVSDMLVSTDAHSHLEHFAFAGRLLGKALFDGFTVKPHLVRPLYMHLLGWPVRFADLEHIDADSYNSLRQLAAMAPEEIESLGLDFSVMESVVSRRVVELCPAGAERDVDGDNLQEYLEAMTRFKLLGMARLQTAALLRGFYDVLPEVLLSVFDFQELELLLCGLPEIDLGDWRLHTEYRGLLERKGAAHKVVGWFWDAVEAMDEEKRARLLQFVTGTSGVPVQGFAALQGHNGIQRFCLNGIALTDAPFPRAHTCFNRIDLPLYTSAAQLTKFVNLAVQMEVTGFGIE